MPTVKRVHTTQTMQRMSKKHNSELKLVLCQEQKLPTPVVPICDQPTRVSCLFHGQAHPTATGALPPVDHLRGTVYLQHCDQPMFLLRLSEHN